MKFYIFGGGDESVGLPATDEVVTFEGNMNLDDNSIKTIKQMLLEFDDNGASVLTEKEYNEMLKEEEQAFKQEDK